MRPPLLALVVVVVVMVVVMAGPAMGLRRCQQPARFSVDGVEPMQVARGNVTLVALLTTTCPFCLSQARRLQAMRESDDYPGVHMMIVNGGPRRPGVFEGIVSFPVYHDDARHQLWRQVFRGNKDDILIFNRCGKLTYRLRFPHSYLGYRYARRALANTESNPDICPCTDRPDQTDPHDVMQADSPHAHGFESRGGSRLGRRGQGSGSGSMSVSRSGSRRRGHVARGARRRGRGRQANRSRCPAGDSQCRQLRRERRRRQRLERARGAGRGAEREAGPWRQGGMTVGGRGRGGGGAV